MPASENTTVGPLAPNAVRGVLVALERQLSLRPSLIDDPSFLFMVRLALTAGSKVQVTSGEGEFSQSIVPEPTDTGEALWTLLREVNQTRHNLALVQEELSQARVAKEKAEQAFAELLQEVQRHKGHAEQLQTRLEKLTVEYNTTTAEATKQIATAKAEAKANCEENAALRARIEKAVSDLQAAEEARAADKSASKESIKKVLEEWEWSAKHREYSFRENGKPIPACPICGRMDPSRVQHQQAGHVKGCWFIDFKKHLLRTV